MATTIERVSELPNAIHNQLCFVSKLEEAVVFCPLCKTMETVLINSNGRLVPTRKFYQVDGRVYHNCGATEPCRLYCGY